MPRTLFNPNSKEQFKLSRTKLELFVGCPRCFYLDLRKGVSRPPGFPFTLNMAVDALLKKEFDIHRANSEPHPLMKTYKIDAIPFAHEKLDYWRRVGIYCNHRPTNFAVYGKVDDVWIDPKGNLIIVDYKATSTSEEIDMETGKPHHLAYKREVEIYQWLFRQNNFRVSDTAYFVYVNALKDRKAFDGKLEFDVQIIPHQGSDKWVEEAVSAGRKCLESDRLPEASADCEFCAYRQRAEDVGD